MSCQQKFTWWNWYHQEMVPSCVQGTKVFTLEEAHQTESCGGILRMQACIAIHHLTHVFSICQMIWVCRKQDPEKNPNWSSLVVVVVTVLLQFHRIFWTKGMLFGSNHTRWIIVQSVSFRICGIWTPSLGVFNMVTPVVTNGVLGPL